MRKVIFCFMLGVACGFFYSQDGEFTDWIDDGIDMGKDKAEEVFGEAKSVISEKKDDALNTDTIVFDAIANGSTEDVAEEYRKKQLELLEKAEKE